MLGAMLILEPPRELLEHWFPGLGVRRLGRLEGGYVNDVFRVECGGEYVLRICVPETRLEMVLWEHDLLDYLGPRVPEVPAPVPAADGATAVEWDGRIASLFPYVEGHRPVRMRRQHRIAAAHTLARIHRAAASFGRAMERPGHSRWWRLDWRENRWWHWSRAHSALARAASEAPGDLDPSLGEIAGVLERHLAVLPKAVEELRWRRLPEHAIHGDYHEGNLGVVDDHVVGVFDWDEARLDWRACELADATWAFCRNPWNDDFDRDAAGDFLAAYRDAGGEVTDAERGVLVLLMRARRLWEALYAVGEWSLHGKDGDEADWYYLAANARALDHLEGIEAL
jgi:Ser/Thr protein kinase RdoA (MazF antagonist)